MFSRFFKPNIKKMIKKADIEGLRGILKAENSNDRLKFFEVVNNVEEDLAVSLLKDTLADMWPSDRKKAIKFFGEKKNPNSIESLIENLDYHESIDALINIGAPCIEPMISLLYKDCEYQSDERRKINALEVLGKIKDDRAIKYFINIVKEKENTLTPSVIKSLGLIGNSECIDLLIELLSSTDEYERSGAYNAILRIERDKITDPLLNALYSIDNNPDFQDIIISLLVEFGDVRAVQNIVESLKSRNDKIRSVSIKALEKLNSIPQLNVQKNEDKTTELLIEALFIYDDNPDFQKVIISLLGKIGDARAVQNIIQLLKSKNDKIHSASIKALKQIKWIPQSEEQELWMSAIKGKWHEVKNFELAIIPAIRLLVYGDNKYLRKGAAKILGDIGDDRSISVLIDALKDDDISEIARDSLVKLKEISLEPLTSSLNSNSGGYSDKLRIIEAIEKINDFRAIIPLFDFIKNSRGFGVKGHAESALKNLSISSYRLNENFTIKLNKSSSINKSGGMNIPDIFIQALSDKNEDVRRVAAEVLGSLGKNHFINLVIEAWKQNKIQSSVLIKLITIPSSKKYLEILKEILISGPQFDRILAAEALNKLNWKPSNLKEQVYLWLGEEEWSKIFNFNEVEHGHLKEVFQYYYRPEKKDILLTLIENIGVAGNDYFDDFISDEYISRLGDTFVERAIVKTLTKFNTIKALDTLVAALDDSHYYVRHMAVEKLAEVGYKPAEKPLIEKLGDKHFRINELSVKLLDKLNWKPEPPNSLYYYIEKNDCDEVLKIGKNAVDRLIDYIEEFKPTNKSKLFAMNMLCELKDLRASHTLLREISRHKISFESWRNIPSNDKLKYLFGDYTELIINTLSYSIYDDPQLGKRKSGTHSTLKGDKSIKELNYSKNTKFVKKLCAIKTPIADNLLNIMKNRAYERYSENWMFHECLYGYEKEGIFIGVNLGTQCRLSEEELNRRGNPPYNKAAFLISGNWYF